MTLPSSPPKEKMVVQKPPANEPAEKSQLSFAFGKVRESKQAAEQNAKAAEQVTEQNDKATEQVTEQNAKFTEQVTEQNEKATERTAEQNDEATEQAGEQNNEVLTDEVDVSPPQSVTVDQMMKNSTPTNSQSESRHTPSLSPINEHVSCHM